jgi:hypothetical protein
MSYLSATRTVQNVVDYVKRQFGDESGVQITDADVIRWVNAGQDEIFRRNEPVKASSVANIVSGQHTYQFPADVLKVQSLLYNGKPVKVMSYQEAEEYLLDEDPNRVQTGVPEIWYEWGGDFTLWPTPDANIVGGLSIKYVKAPAAVVNVNSVLATPDVYFNRLVEFCLQQAYELDENWAAAESKAQQFGENVQQQAGNGATQANTYPRITVLEEDQ